MPDQQVPLSQALERAVADHRAGRLQEAEVIYQKILGVNQSHADALHLLGVIKVQTGRESEAIGLFEKAISRAPEVSRYHSSLGLALQRTNRLDDAMVSCGYALKFDPNNIDAHIAFGHIHQSKKDWRAAEDSYRKALNLSPDHGLALMYLANTLQESGRFEEAEIFYRRLLAVAPLFAEGHKNFAVALSQSGRLDEAIASMREAIRLQPDEASWNMALGQLLLLNGEFDEGWAQYEWRWRAKNVPSKPRGFAQPHWDGDDTRGKILLLHAEQGLGDAIQFCRYVSKVAARSRVILEVPQPLVRLLASIDGVEAIVATGKPLPEFDYHCPLMSLPRLLRTTLHTIPGDTPYLAVDEAQIAVWRERLRALSGLRVGLAWTGGVVTPRNPQRSVSTALLSLLSGIEGVSFVSLQKYQIGSMRQRIPADLGMTDWTDEIEDLADTAALISALDLVISVDTSVAHLSGALGKPTWLLNRFSPCWRWLLNRDDSPWYPTLRQFRQPRLDDWESVLAKVRLELAQYRT